MTLYTLALFVHVVGAIGIFAGLSVWAFGVAGLRSAQRVEQVRLLAALVTASSSLVIGGVVILGVAGFYMALTAWGVMASWIIVATISFLLLAPGGMLVLERRMRAIAALAHATPNGPLPETLAARTRDPILATGLCVYIACLFGIVFLMTNKPPLTDAIAAILVAVALGLLASLPFWRPRVKPRPAP
jgi:predicted tellurium resistance membrane protein TerC